MNYNYSGWFLPAEELYSAAGRIRPHRLEKLIRYPHITLAYKPERVPEEWLGTTAVITAIGYGNDGENEGLLVKLETAEPSLQRAFDGLKAPHITLSVSREGKPVNTGSLKFRPIDPIVLTGVFGALPFGGAPVLSAE